MNTAAAAAGAGQTPPEPPTGQIAELPADLMVPAASDAKEAVPASNGEDQTVSLTERGSGKALADLLGAAMADQGDEVGEVDVTGRKLPNDEVQFLFDGVAWREVIGWQMRAAWPANVRVAHRQFPTRSASVHAR